MMRLSRQQGKARQGHKAARRCRASCAACSMPGAGLAVWRSRLSLLLVGVAAGASLLTVHGVARALQLSQLRVLEPRVAPFAPDEATASNPCLSTMAQGLRLVVHECGKLWQGVLSVFAPPLALDCQLPPFLRS